MGRRTEREMAFKYLYATEIHRSDSPEMREVFCRSQGVVIGKNDKFFNEIVSGVLTHKAVLNDIIASHLHNWKLERLPIVDLCIMRIALFEMTVQKQTDVSIIISEALRLAGLYSDENAKSYINGVLGACDKEAKMSAEQKA